MKIYALLNSSDFTVDLRDKATVPSGYIEMKSEPPKNNKTYVAKEGGKWLLDINSECNKVCNAIDITAGNARRRLVSEGYAIEEEYRIAHKEAKAYLEALNNEDAENIPVPPAIKVDIETNALSAKAAAKVICNRHDAWSAAIDSIRNIRLRGKAAVKKAARATPEADLMTIAQPFIDQINTLHIE